MQAATETDRENLLVPHGTARSPRRAKLRWKGSVGGQRVYTLSRREAKKLFPYNNVRPHSALDYRPPVPEAILPLPPGSAPLHPAATAYGLT